MKIVIETLQQQKGSKTSENLFASPTPLSSLVVMDLNFIKRDRELLIMIIGQSYLPFAATVHFLSKQTTQGSGHVDKESLFRHPHSLQKTK